MPSVPPPGNGNVIRSPQRNEYTFSIIVITINKKIPFCFLCNIFSYYIIDFAFCTEEFVIIAVNCVKNDYHFKKQ